MNEEYYKNIFSDYKKSKFGDYIIYSGNSKEYDGEDFYSYNDWNNLINMYYDNKLYVEETDEQRTMRLAKEKAKKRNNTIDQILGK